VKGDRGMKDGGEGREFWQKLRSKTIEVKEVCTESAKQVYKGREEISKMSKSRNDRGSE
jgi:hypothetical protein